MAYHFVGDKMLTRGSRRVTQTARLQLVFDVGFTDIDLQTQCRKTKG